MDSSWPNQLVAQLKSRFGGPTATERMFGLSANQVWRVAFAHKQVVVKASANPAEAYFYAHVAPILEQNGVAVPSCLGQVDANGRYWLILTYIPHPFPRERWLADREALQLLQCLHATNLEKPPSTYFQPNWTDEMTARACQLLETSPQQQRQLCEMQTLTQPLFATQRWISGDPNPKNWGVGANGRLYLFDWERFGLGDPALDLAITIPGFRSRPDFEHVAQTYLAAHARPAPIQKLTEKMIQAKVWSIIEFLDAVANGNVADTAGVPYLQEHFFPWLNQIAKSG